MNSTTYKYGSLVKINNREHVWHDEIAIIRGRKDNGFYKVELLGKVVTIPPHWLLPVEEDEPA